jgi:ketosteroid isomerase-like protein
MEEEAMTYSAIIDEFYRAFQERDWQRMNESYHIKIVFSDPVFQHLAGEQAKAMWHMLTTSARDLTVAHSKITTNGNEGACHWEAWYTFSKTGAKVHNVIDAKFEFLDGKIIKHTDSFDLRKWAGMALGVPGRLLGWTPWMQGKIRATAASSLARFCAQHPEYLANQNQP